MNAVDTARNESLTPLIRLLKPSFALAGRAIRLTARKPQFLAPLVIFPTLLLAVNSAGLEHSLDLPGFPKVRSFLDFSLAAALTQSLLLGGVSAGIATALEIEGGFFDRLVTTPIPRTAIVLGRLSATALLSMLQAVYFLTLGLVFGAHIVSGIGGFILILLLSMLTGVGFGAIGITLALRAQNASTVQGIFPLVFVLLFLSSAFFPEHLLSQPASTISHYNPLSYISNGIRNPIISEISAKQYLEGVVAAAGICLRSISAAINALRVRLRSG